MRWSVKTSPSHSTNRTSPTRLAGKLTTRRATDRPSRPEIAAVADEAEVKGVSEDDQSAVAPGTHAGRRRASPRRTSSRGGTDGRPAIRSGSTAGGQAVADERAVAAADDAPAGYADRDGDEDAPGVSAVDEVDPDGESAAADTDAGAVGVADDLVGVEGDSEIVDEWAEDEDEALLAAGATGGGWTIPLLCLGIAVIACCLVIPQADANRRLGVRAAGAPARPGLGPGAGRDQRRVPRQTGRRPDAGRAAGPAADEAHAARHPAAAGGPGGTPARPRSTSCR